MQATLGMSGSGTGGANGSVSLMSQLWCNNDVSLNPFSTGTLFCIYSAYYLEIYGFKNSYGD